MSNPKPHFPFTAITGQETFKLALILAAINPQMGGVLVSGARGMAKTTLARGFADLLPKQSQFITLPLGCSEEMLVGSLDLQQALSEQNIQFNAGLLAKAHQGVLYVDEVNLLPDHLVDLLLDVAASKSNVIERDGISHQHEADFLLIGTMNPDEGELRPQLQDRFALCVELNAPYTTQQRVEIVRQREQFDADPHGFYQQHIPTQQTLIQNIKQAQQQLNSITCADHWRVLIAEKCQAAQVDGLRADIVWYRAALAHAAWQNKAAMDQDDIDAVEELVLVHRRKTQPPQQQKPPSLPPFSRPPETQQNQTKSQGDWGAMSPQKQATEYVQAPSINRSNTEKKTMGKLIAGKKKGAAQRGQAIGKSQGQHLDWFQTLSHFAQHQTWQAKYKRDKTGKALLHLVLLDTSASVLQGQAFAKAKGVILALAEQAYLLREQLMILGFGNEKVEQLLSIRRAPKQLKQWLDQLSAAGGTPLQAVLQQAQQTITHLKKQQSGLAIQAYIVTDACVTHIPAMELDAQCMVIDTEQSAVKRGRGQALAKQLQAEYITLKV